MDIIFENSYTITLEKYLSYCDYPIGKTAKNRLKKWKFKMVIAAALFIIGALIFAYTKEWVGLTITLALFMICPYRVLFQRKVLNKKIFNLALQAFDSNTWIRTTTFSDDIKVKDGNSESTFQYSYIKKISEDNEYYYLWHDDDFIIRIFKTGFSIGNPKGFNDFIQSKIMKN